MKNRLSLFFTVLLLTQLTFASTGRPLSLQFQMTCVTEFPTTSFVGSLEGSQLKVRLVNHNGVGLMPITSSLMTSNDIPLLQKRARELKSIGSDTVMSFDLKDCLQYPDQTFSCFGSHPLVPEGLQPLQALSLSVSRLKTQTLGQTVEEVQISARLRAHPEDAAHEVTMRYSPNECQLQL